MEYNVLNVSQDRYDYKQNENIIRKIKANIINESVNAILSI